MVADLTFVVSHECQGSRGIISNAHSVWKDIIINKTQRRHRRSSSAAVRRCLPCKR